MQPERKIAEKKISNYCIYYIKESNEIAMYNGVYFHKGMQVEQIMRSKLSNITKSYEQRFIFKLYLKHHHLLEFQPHQW